MTHLDLFSGIGGFALAARWMGWETVQFVELDKFCQKVLQKNFPNVPIHGDIKTFDGTRFRGTVDIVTGGPPCQPASSAGKRKGEKDDRWLWPEAIRIFGEVRPGIAVFENPDDLLSLDDGQPFERICSAMEDFGYKVETYGIPAACVGAWHERDRIWIIAYDDNILDSRGLADRTDKEKTKSSQGSDKQEGQASNGQRVWAEYSQCSEAIADTHSQGLQGSTQAGLRSVYESDESLKGCPAYGGTATPGAYWSAEPGVGRMVYGVPCELHIIRRIENDESSNQESKPESSFAIWKTMRTLWEHREFAEASPELFIRKVCDSLSIMPCESGPVGWLQESKEAKELRGLWQAFYAKSYEEAQDMQSRVLECYREIERTKKMEQKQRVNRIKALGNAIVPQIALEIFKAIEAVNNSV